jgi:hypothetical protein
MFYPYQVLSSRIRKLKIDRNSSQYNNLVINIIYYNSRIDSSNIEVIIEQIIKRKVTLP